MNELETLNTGNNGEIIYYNGEDDIVGLKTREDFISNNDKQICHNMLTKKQIYFMPVDVNESFNRPYQIIVFGSLIIGSKAKVILTNIDVFVDILIPEYIDIQDFKSIINIELSNKIRWYKLEVIYVYPLHGYNENKIPVLRIYIDNIYDRKNIINIYKHSYKLFNNDNNHYYRKVAREYKISFNDWILLTNFTYSYENDLHVFTININDYKKVVDSNKLSKSCFIKDKTLLISWDIETYSSNKTDHRSR
jgi:hypothetical protein